MVLVERQGGVLKYYADVVYDACTMHNVGTATHISPDCWSMLSQVTGWNPLIARRFGVARWLKVVVVSCDGPCFASDVEKNSKKMHLTHSLDAIHSKCLVLIVHIKQ